MADQLRALVSARPLKFALLGLLGLAIWLRAQLAADPLSEVDCAALTALSVFSHRGLSGEGNERPESAIPTAASLVALSERGVAHFDMDLFFTDEAEQYVAHPDALAKVLGVPDVGALSSRQLARAMSTAAPGRQLLPVSELLTLAARFNWTLALDLKGAGRPAFRGEMERLAAQVQRLRLERTVSLWVESSALARRLPDALRLGKPLRDLRAPRHAEDGAPDCTAAIEPTRDAKLYSFLGPSRRCANRHLLHTGVRPTAAWRGRARGWLVWVVDSPRSALHTCPCACAAGLEDGGWRPAPPGGPLYEGRTWVWQWHMGMGRAAREPRAAPATLPPARPPVVPPTCPSAGGAVSRRHLRLPHTPPLPSRRPAELAPLASRGVDQVISNYPLRMLAAVDAARRKRKCTR